LLIFFKAAASTSLYNRLHFSTKYTTQLSSRPDPLRIGWETPGPDDGAINVRPVHYGKEVGGGDGRRGRRLKSPPECCCATDELSSPQL